MFSLLDFTIETGDDSGLLQMVQDTLSLQHDITFAAFQTERYS
jgi:hypothetical protein